MTLDELLDHCAMEAGTSVEEIKHGQNKEDVRIAKLLFIIVARDYLGATWYAVSKKINVKRAAGSIYAHKLLKKYSKKDPWIMESLEHLKSLCKNYSREQNEKNIGKQILEYREKKDKYFKERMHFVNVDFTNAEWDAILLVNQNPSGIYKHSVNASSSSLTQTEAERMIDGLIEHKIFLEKTGPNRTKLLVLNPEKTIHGLPPVDDRMLVDMRKCLKCGDKFESEWCGIRICEICRSHEAFKSGPCLETTYNG